VLEEVEIAVDILGKKVVVVEDWVTRIILQLPQVVIQ
jgi:hypothetical protein